MTVSLPADLEPFVADQIAKGEFGSAEDLIVEAVRRLREEQEFRGSILEAEKEFESGGGIDGEEAFRQLREYALKLSQSSK